MKDRAGKGKLLQRFDDRMQQQTNLNPEKSLIANTVEINDDELFEAAPKSHSRSLFLAGEVVGSASRERERDRPTSAFADKKFKPVCNNPLNSNSPPDSRAVVLFSGNSDNITPESRTRSLSKRKNIIDNQRHS